MIQVGCGDGRLTAGLAEQAASVFAFDPDAESVAAAKARMPQETSERVTFRAGSAEQIEIPRFLTRSGPKIDQRPGAAGFARTAARRQD